MRISICIPTYNQARYLPKAIESVLMQTSREIIELIVCDDASTDGTAGVMKKYQGDPRVRFIQQAANLGISGNTTYALRQARGELVVRLDSDDRLEPEFVKTLAKEFENRPSLGVAHAAVSEIDEDDRHCRIRQLMRPTGFQSGEEALMVAHQGYKVAANICMFRRAALKQCGYYREGMNFAEDWDLWTRLAAAGWENYYSNQSMACYRVWNDAGGYRKGRKVSELQGILGVFNDTLQPAYFERGWDSGCLGKARRNVACGHVRALRRIPRGSEDFSEIVDLLRDLGAGPELSIRLLLVRSGCGCMLDWFADAKLAARDVAKKIFTRKR